MIGVFSYCLLKRIITLLQKIILRLEVLYQYKNGLSICIFNRWSIPDFKNYRPALRTLLPNTKQQQKNNKEPKVWEGLFSLLNQCGHVQEFPKYRAVSNYHAS